MCALIRCPVADQPGAGGKVRGTTGPSSSVQMGVSPWGGSVEWVTTVVLLGRASLSRGVPQLCVCRKPTPSRSRMVRIWLRLTRMPASLAACTKALRRNFADPCRTPRVWLLGRQERLQPLTTTVASPAGPRAHAAPGASGAARAHSARHARHLVPFFFLRPRYDQHGMGKPRQRDVAIPGCPGAYFILIQPHLV